MEPVITYGAGATESFVTPLSLVALVLTCVLICFLPRKYTIVAVLSSYILIPIGQQFYFWGVHLFFHRIFIGIGLLKAAQIRRSEAMPLAGGLNEIDRSFLCYVSVSAIAFSLLHQEIAAVINQGGFIWDSLGGYILMRLLIRDQEDIERAVKCISYIFALIALGMLIEQAYMVNIFACLGGQIVPELRNGSVRSMGPFRHTLTAGTAGATAAPLFIFLWYRNNHRAISVLGVVFSTIMVLAAHSSGPLLAYAAGIIALLTWRQRERMRLLRRTAILLIIALCLLMKAPVWFLIARIDLTGSSSSYHRANLIDQFVNHFSQWWLIGTKDSYSWGWDLWDAQNQYVSTGVRGGLGALIILIAVIAYGFIRIGKTRNGCADEQHQRRLWIIGSTLFSFIVAFFGVNLFDQSQMLWLMLLAMISAATVALPASKKTFSKERNIYWQRNKM